MEFRPVRRSVATFNVVFVLVGYLLGHRLRHRVQRVESVFVGQLRFIDYRPQIPAERLGCGEIDTAVGGIDGTARDLGSVNEVENTIRRGILLLVQPVQAHQTDQRYTFLGTFCEETVRRACRITCVKDVQTELVGRNLIGRKIVHVLHHQLPQWGFGIQGGTLQQLDTQTVRSSHLVGELTHLIHLVVTDHRVLERHGQHLVGCQRGIQRDEAQLGVHRVLVGGKQSRTLHLFVVGARFQTDGLHVARHVGDVPDERTVGVGRQVVGVVVRKLSTGIGGVVGDVGELRVIFA